MSKEIVNIKKSSRRTKLIGSNKNSKKVFNSRKEGKDIKSLSDRQGIVPFISVNNKKIINNQGRKINSFDPITLGLGQNIISTTINSFKDFPDIDPVFLIQNGSPYEAYPFVYDAQQNNERYREKENMSLDGIVEIFEIRREKKITDIEITGIKAALGSAGYITVSNASLGKKGSALISENEEYGKKENDFFEDCQDVFFGEYSFPAVGNIDITNRKFSNQGFNSTGKNIDRPFKEEEVFNENYTFLDENSKNNLLKNSKRNVSDLGTRFKTTGNSFIISQFENNINKKRIGTDSISFIGLLKG